MAINYLNNGDAYDLAAINAVMAEWTRIDQTYAQRVDHLLNGGGLNGSTLLNLSTAFDDAAVDTLTGGAGLDWFGLRLRTAPPRSQAITPAPRPTKGTFAVAPIAVGTSSLTVTDLANSSARRALNPPQIPDIITRLQN